MHKTIEFDSKIKKQKQILSNLCDCKKIIYIYI